jgi:hypothetical protein
MGAAVEIDVGECVAEGEALAEIPVVGECVAVGVGVGTPAAAAGFAATAEAGTDEAPPPPPAQEHNRIEAASSIGDARLVVLKNVLRKGRLAVNNNFCD